MQLRWRCHHTWWKTESGTEICAFSYEHPVTLCWWLVLSSPYWMKKENTESWNPFASDRESAVAVFQVLLDSGKKKLSFWILISWTCVPLTETLYNAWKHLIWIVHNCFMQSQRPQKHCCFPGNFFFLFLLEGIRGFGRQYELWLSKSTGMCLPLCM